MGEPSEQPAVGRTEPGTPVDWLDRCAATADLARDELAMHLRVLPRFAADPIGADSNDADPTDADPIGADSNDADPIDAGPIDAGPSRHVRDDPAQVRRELVDDAFARHGSAVERAVADGLVDVRTRLVSLERDLEEKAPREHGHEANGKRADAIDGSVRALASDLEGVDRALDRLNAAVDDGFERHEAVLSTLVERTESLDERLTKLAHVVLDTERELARHRFNATRRDRLDEITTVAHAHRCRTASCERCASAIDVALLQLPDCPHCGLALSRLDPKRGLFDANVLRSDDRPELEASQGSTVDRHGATATRRGST